jgi:trimeric autotransporter adhesin
MPSRPRLVAFALSVTLAQFVSAQCWTIDHLDVPAGISGSPRWVNTATLWDPDGPGPETRRLVVAGAFNSIGGVFARHVAQWDGTRWSPLTPAGLDNIFDLLALPDGTLLAAGAFSQPSRGIARFDGTTWQPVGLGVSSSVNDLLLLPDGSVLLAGNFTAVEGNPAGRLARYDPAAGTLAPFPAPNGSINGRVYAAEIARDGSIIIVGNFSTVEGIPASRVARWDGNAWSALGSGIDGAEAYDLAFDADSTLYVGGRFTAAGGVPALNIAAWNGTEWSALPSPGLPGVNQYVGSLVTDPSGGILVSGDFTQAGDLPIARLAHWNNGWSDPGALLGPDPSTLLNLDGTAAVTGSFDTAGGYPAYGLAFRNDAGEWLPTTTTPYTNDIQAFATLPDGRLVAAAAFYAFESLGTTRLLVRDAEGWQPLSSPYAGTVRALLPMPDGSIVVAGSLTAVGGTSINNIARWTPGGDLGSWHPLASGVSGSVYALARFNTDIIAAGEFAAAGGIPASNIARFDGTTWSPLTSGTDRRVTALLAASDGTLVVAGDFNAAGGLSTRGAARWNGSAWTPMSLGNVTPNINALAESPTLGIFAARPSPLRWNGFEWTPIALDIRSQQASSVRGRALAILPDGDLVFAGSFASIDGVPAQSLARWNGQGWASLNPAFFSAGPVGVDLLAVTPAGDLAVAGDRTEWAFWTAATDTEPEPPVIALEPNDILTCSRTTVTLAMLAEYSGTISYRWYDASGPSQQSLLGTGTSLTLETPIGRRTVVGVAAGAPCDGSVRTRTVTLYGVLVDQNFDGFIDFFDFTAFLLYFERGFPQADVNRDGFLDFFDYDLFLQFFEQGC